MGQPLEGLKVLDLTWHLAGPYATKLIADYGADVLKVERTGLGDPARMYGPFPGDIPHLERSGAFLHLNTNKRGVTLNLKTEAGKSVLMELAKGADVLVESFSPGIMDCLGLDYDSVARVNPRLIMCSVSNYGQTGPCKDWKATDLTMYGHAGLLYSMGIPEREPLKSLEHLTEYQAGATAAAAVVGAALHQTWSGEGQHIDVSLFEVASGTSDRRITRTLGYEYAGVITGREPIGTLPSGAVLPCSDGYALIIVSPPSRWPRVFEMLGAPDLGKRGGANVGSPWALPETREEVDALLYPWFLERTKQRAMAEGQAHGMPISAINGPADILRDPHLTARGYFVEADHAEAGRLAYAGRGLYFDDKSWDMRRPPPLLGQHNDEVFRGELGFSRHDLASLRMEGAI